MGPVLFWAEDRGSLVRMQVTLKSLSCHVACFAACLWNLELLQFMCSRTASGAAHDFCLLVGQERFHWTLPCEHWACHQPNFHYRAYPIVVCWCNLCAACQGSGHLAGSLLLPLQLEHCACRRLLPCSGKPQWQWCRAILPFSVCVRTMHRDAET